MERLCFWSPPALLGMPGPPIAGIGLDVRASQNHHHQAHVSAVGRSASAAGAAVEASSTAPAGARRSYMLPRPVLRLWPGKGVDGRGGGGEEESAAREPLEEEQRAMGQREEGEEEQGTAPSEEGRDNWVLKILRVRSILTAEDRKPGAARDGTAEERWASTKEDSDGILHGEDRCVGCCDAEGSEGFPVGDEEDEGAAKIDKDTFLGLLRRVSLAEVRLFGQLTYLGSLAYNVPKIKPSNLLKHYSLRFITSSVEKKSKIATAEQVHPSAPHREPPQEEAAAETGEKSEQQQKNGPMTSAAAAYQIAATAASHTLNMLPWGTARTESGVGRKEDENLVGGSEVTSFMATTNSVTAVVAAKEETKQAVAEDLNSARSSPCEWFICDDDSRGTRFFVIQGSESLASWKANLLFEPVQFEGLDVLVHRGIYEAAKGIYDRMLPEVREYLRTRGDSAAFRFTGHSLGGSLSLLVSLMLLIRGEVRVSSLLPVVMFGAPYVMCGGNSLLRRLGLPLSHVQAVTLHRDIVPRAFSCNYPDHVAEILKAVNGNFRNLPCLKHRKLLYAPMGEFLILQPEEKFSPHHHLLPAGAGLYMLGQGSSAATESARLLRAAQTLFLNSPHPLEMLSDRAAYGAEGTVYRDHDVNAYLRSVRGVIHQELRRAKKAKMERRRRTWWPLVAAAPGAAETDFAGLVPAGSGRGAGKRRSNGHRQLAGFPGVLLQGGRQSLLRRLASSRRVHMLVVLLLPAKLLLLGALQIVVSFG